MTTNARELELFFGQATHSRTKRGPQERKPHIVAILPRGEAIRNFVYSGTLEEVDREVEVTVLSVLPGGESEDRLRRCGENLFPLEEIPERRAVNTLRELLEWRAASGMFSEDINSYIARQTTHGHYGTRIRDLPDGRTISVTNRPIKNGGWVAVHEDITERRKAEARIEFLAHHDGLTELPNRVLFTERLEVAIRDKKWPIYCILERDNRDEMGTPTELTKKYMDYMKRVLET